MVFLFKQRTAYEVRSRDWSSDVCSSDLVGLWLRRRQREAMSGRAQVYHPQPSRCRDLAFLAVVLLICAALLGVFGMAMYSSLVKFWRYDLSDRQSVV